MSLPDSTPQQHSAAIPGIKLSHLVYLAKGADQRCTAYILELQIRECIFSLQHYVSKELFITSAGV
jgi:hypothetical protein